MTLYELRKSNEFEVAVLLTTVTEGYERISMHGVRRVLLEEQAKSLGIALEKVYISKGATNAEYESKMERILRNYLAEGISHVAFGDIFLEDLRKYRETNLAKIGMSGIFPIWKRDTKELSRTFINLGFKAILTCIDSNCLNEKFAGRLYDETLLSEFPASVDPCGENGEFHSFVFGGPYFKKEIAFEKGETVLRDERFYFADLIPVASTAIPVS